MFFQEYITCPLYQSVSFKENIDISNKQSDTKEIQLTRHKNDRMAEAAKGST